MAKEQIILYGIHAVSAVCEHKPELVYELLLTKGNDNAKVSPIYKMAKRHNIPLRQVNRAELDKKTNALHQGVVAICRQIPTGGEHELKAIVAASDKPFLLVLDGVQDPHNLGACMRSANAMGADAVVIPKNDSCNFTAVVHKVSCGASLMTPLIVVGNLARAMQQIAQEGVWFVGLDARADKQLHEIDLNCGIGIVMGAEGSGLRRLTQERCDFLAKLPMPGEVESLNVSVAAGISLYEVVRQR